MKIDSSSNYQSVSCVLNNNNSIPHSSEKGMQNPRKKEQEKEISPNKQNFFSPNRHFEWRKEDPQPRGPKGGLGWVRFRIFQTFLKDATRFFFSFFI